MRPNELGPKKPKTHKNTDAYYPLIFYWKIILIISTGSIVKGGCNKFLLLFAEAHIQNSVKNLGKSVWKIVIG